MQLLNTTFKRKSNVLCNRFISQAMRIGDMQKTGDMHETMRRLYQAANELMGWKGQSEVAHRLNQSPQTLNNWEARGMSKGGMLNAQRVLGCSAVWLETGQGKMVGQNIPKPLELTNEQREISTLWKLLIPSERDELLAQIRRQAAHNKAVMSLMNGGQMIGQPKKPSETEYLRDRLPEDEPDDFHRQWVKNKRAEIDRREQQIEVENERRRGIDRRNDKQDEK